MLGTILKRTLVWSLPLAAAYLSLLFVFGPSGKPWLSLAALLFPIFAVIFEATRIHKKNLALHGGKQEARQAELIWCWSGIVVCVLVFFITWPVFHGAAIGWLIAATVCGRRLFAPAR